MWCPFEILKKNGICGMSLEKNTDLILYPCGIQLASITNNDVVLTAAFAVSPSSIRLLSRSTKDQNGILYRNTITADFAGLDVDTFELLDQYCRDEYQVRALMTDGKLFEIAPVETPMQFSTSSSNALTSLTLETTAIGPIKYLTNVNAVSGLPRPLTFRLS